MPGLAAVLILTVSPVELFAINVKQLAGPGVRGHGSSHFPGKGGYLFIKGEYSLFILLSIMLFKEIIRKWYEEKTAVNRSIRWSFNVQQCGFVRGDNISWKGLPPWPEQMRVSIAYWPTFIAGSHTDDIRALGEFTLVGIHIWLGNISDVHSDIWVQISKAEVNPLSSQSCKLYGVIETEIVFLRSVLEYLSILVSVWNKMALEENWLKNIYGSHWSAASLESPLSVMSV